MSVRTIEPDARRAGRLVLRLGFRSAGLVAVFVYATGCVVLPIPTPEHTPLGTVTRQNISANDADWIQPGTTLLADILLKFGEPDQLSPDGQTLGYRWQKIWGYMVIGVPGGGDVAPWLKEYHLVIECDAGGLVKNKRTTNRLFSKPSPQELFAGGDVTAGTVAADGMTISGPAEWFAGVAGYDRLRTKGWLSKAPPKGVLGRLMLTDNELYFREQGHLLSGPPVLTLRFDRLSECRLDKYGLGRRLVVRSTTGEVHTFTFWSAREGMEDAKTTRAAYEFIQFRILQ